MLPAFNSPSGYPYVTFDFETGKPVKDPYGSLANVGTCQLEFTRLSLLTGDNKYRQAALKVFDTLDKNKAGKGLYYNEVNIQTGKYASTSFSLGAGADSFFEYLIKLYIMLGPKDTTRNKYLTMFDDSMTVMKQKLLTKCYKNRLCLGHTDSSGRLINEMHHLEFFIPAMLLLGNEHLPSKGLKPIALDLLETYSAIPQLTVTGLAPENTRFSNTSEIQVASRQNYLRPELVESLFYGYRNTEDKKYQDRSYALFKAFQTYSKTNYGFAEYMDVNSKDKQQQQHDVMGSFFYAEAMKYMYLIHAPKNTFDFSKWVFNTEAHPFKISNA
ncbi:seven-hairpin glycosidase [Neoconidiobolus thromboides FSU 785]|nr:seven-hairpin glycosidase [Neoconidiobolus thromboides FSU 785]